MNQSEFVRIFKEKTGLETIFRSRKAVDAFFEILEEGLKRDGIVNFSGHGRFKLKVIKSKPIVHPVTKEKLQTKEKVVALFKNADKFKKRLNAVK